MLSITGETPHQEMKLLQLEAPGPTGTAAADSLNEPPTALAQSPNWVSPRECCVCVAVLPAAGRLRAGLADVTSLTSVDRTRWTVGGGAEGCQGVRDASCHAL